MIEAARQLLLVQQKHLPAGGRLVGQTFLFLFRSVDPNDSIRLAQPGHFFNPLLKFAVLMHDGNDAS